MIKLGLAGVIVVLVLFSFGSIDKKYGYDLKEGSIINLYDAFSRNPSLTKDFGFSCIIKHNGRVILFDSGTNADFFKSNLETLGIDPKSIDIVVLSHTDYDHINGLEYLLTVNPKVKMYFPHDSFWGAPVSFNVTGQDSTAVESLPKHMRYYDGEQVKFTVYPTGVFWNANIEFVKDSKEILPGTSLIATKSSSRGYFSNFSTNNSEDNYKYTGLPELSLSLQTEDGEVVFVGCSHSSVEKIVEQTKEFTARDIALVCGGFHLIQQDESSIKSLTAYMKHELGVKKVAPAHCTGHLGFKIFSEMYGSDYLYFGLGEEIKYK